MKKILVLLLFVPMLVKAQQQGEITYVTKVTFEFQMDGDQNNADRIREMMPNQRAFNNVLYFKDGKALYVADQNDEPDEIRHSEGDAQFVVRMSTPDNQIYHNLNQNEKLESREFLGKYFLISGEPEKYNWKLTGATKTVAGYNCQEATFSDSTQTVTAWFTPEIPVSLGPGNFGQLPGIILAIDIDNGKRIIEASEIKLTAIDEDKIVQPKKGKKVSQQEFDEIVEKKMEELGGTRGGGGVRMIITEEIGN